MIKRTNIHLFLILFFSIFSISTFAQLQKGQLVDGIAVVVGNEIILDSDITDQMEYAKQQGANVSSRCDFVDGIISNKLLLFEAKKDTLIEDRTAAIKENSAQKYSKLLTNFPSEKAMLENIFIIRFNFCDDIIF